MPCNSDYMMPTPEEIKRLGEKVEALKVVADGMVYASDVMREAVLKANGDDIGQLSIPEVIDVTRRITSFNQQLKVGDDLVTKIRAEYAFNNLGNSPSKRVIDAYLSIRTKYLQAAAAAETLLDGRAVSQDAFNALEQDQIEHRMEDVKRLIKVFTNKGDFKMVAKLAQVDFLQELEPQIGINADDY